MVPRSVKSEATRSAAAQCAAPTMMTAVAMHGKQAERLWTSDHTRLACHSVNQLTASPSVKVWAAPHSFV
jgi:hypothetical protein